MKRIKHWELKLAECIKAAYEQTFVWGTFDCSLFAADTVRELTGVDLADACRGKYTSEDEAYQLIGLPAGRTLGDYVAQSSTSSSLSTASVARRLPTFLPSHSRSALLLTGTPS